MFSTYLVVDVAVGEHCVEVLNALTCTSVEAVLQALFDGPQVHRLLNNFMVILKKTEGLFFYTSQTAFLQNATKSQHPKVSS